MSIGSYLLIGTPGSGSAPATPALAIADNGDGTGATATISGSDAGSSNVVSTAPWIAPGSNLTWTAASPRTGDGTVSLSLANGVYVAKCQSTLGGLPAIVSNEPIFQTTGGNAYTSIHKALGAKVQETIQGMLGSSIIGPTSDSIRLRKTAYLNDFTSQNPLPQNYSYSYPGIVVCYFDVEEISPTGGPNDRNEIGYPITLVFAQETQSANTPSEANDDPFLRWREACNGTFHMLRGSQFNGFLTVTANGKSYTFHKAFHRGGRIFDADESARRKIDVGWVKYSFVLWQGKTGT